MICQGICILHSAASVPRHTHTHTLLHGCTPPHADRHQHLPPHVPTALWACVRGTGWPCSGLAARHHQPGLGRGGRGLALGQKGVPPSPEHLAMALWTMSDAALSHMCPPGPQGVVRRLEEAWLQAGRAEGQQGTGCWGDTASRRDYCYRHGEAEILALSIYTACSQRQAC